MGFIEMKKLEKIIKQLARSEDVETTIGKWLGLDSTKLFEKVIPRHHGTKRIRIDKSWKHKDPKLIIG